MKITINGSAKELAELARALNGTETKEKKPYFPPLLTDIANSERTIKNTREIISFLKKSKEGTEQSKESAPQAETAEHKKNKEFFEKQMNLLSEASSGCLVDMTLYQHLPALTEAMLKLSRRLV